MDDLEQSWPFDRLSKVSLRKIWKAATSLADLVNEYSRTDCKREGNLQWEHLVHYACEKIEAMRADGKRVPDPVVEEKEYVTYFIEIMIGRHDDVIDSIVQRFVIDVTGLNAAEAHIHVTQILTRLEREILSDDKEAQRILPLVREGCSSSEIDQTCGFKPGTADTIMKRIRRRARTFFRALLYTHGRNS